MPLTANSGIGGDFMKTLWRALWLAAVAFGGVALVRIALEILNRDNKRYIEV